MKTNKTVAVALAAAILASGVGVAGSVFTAAPAQAAPGIGDGYDPSSAPTGVKAFPHAIGLMEEIVWIAPYRPTGTVTGYTVTLKQSGKADRTFITKDTRFTLGASTASALTENTSFVVQVKANIVSKSGVKSFSPSVATKFKTPYALTTVKVSSPTSLKISGVTESRLTATWKAPSTLVGSVSNYTVKLKKGDTVVKAVPVGKALTYSFTSLARNTAYTVEVTADAISLRGGNKATSTPAKVSAATLKSSVIKATAPTSLKVTEVTDKSFIAKWSAPTDYVGTVTGYVVRVKQGATVIKTDTVSPSTLSYKVEALKSASAYTVEVNATFASADKMEKADSVVTKVEAYTAKAAAVNLKPVATVSKITSNSAVIDWKPIAGAKTYLTFVSEKGGKLVSRGEYSSTSTSAPLPSTLKPNTTYIADVQAIIPTADGKSWTAYSGTTEFTTASAAPASLKPVVTISDIASTSATVKWINSSATNVTINMVSLAEKNPLKGLGGTRWAPTATSARLDQLKPNTTYIVTVQSFLSGYDSDGNSAYSGTAEFTTKG